MNTIAFSKCVLPAAIGLSLSLGFSLSSASCKSDEDVTKIEQVSELGEFVRACNRPDDIGGSTCTSFYCADCNTASLIESGCLDRYPTLVEGTAGLQMEMKLIKPCPDEDAVGACLFSDAVVNGPGTFYEVDYYYDGTADEAAKSCMKGAIQRGTKKPGRFLAR